MNQINANKHIGSREEFEELRQEVLRHYNSTKRDIQKYQREYKNLLNAKLVSREDANISRSLVKNIDQLQREKSDLEAKLTVALSPIHVGDYERHMYLVACHVLCQEKLNEDIKRLRNEIQDLEKQNLRIDKQTYDLNRKTIPDSQHILYVNKAKKTLFMLENQLDVNRKREGKYCTENACLRKILIELLYERAYFNKIWRRMIGQLNSDKKYLVDLVEIAIGTFENSIQIYQKINAINKKKRREMDLRKREMQNIIRQFTADSVNHQFLVVKGSSRELADLEPREYKRREIFRVFHRKKITLYRAVLDKILSFSGVQFVEQAIEKFQKQENLYYSYFNYANQLNFQVTRINVRINDLYQNIVRLRDSNLQRVGMNLETIADLKTELAKEEQTTNQKAMEKDKVDQKLEALLQGFHNIFKLLHCDETPLMFFLGDHSTVTIFNTNRFLKILEERLNKVLAFVYVNQRKGERKRADLPTVKDVNRKFEEPTHVDDIILAQQCAECAEGEEVNPYDEEFVLPLKKEEVIAKLREKVVAPEMQYRLHSINECRLPRSRLLASKKY